MLLNKVNIKNPYIKKWIPEDLQDDYKDANRWIWKKENKNVLINIVNAEESRLAYFKNSPIVNIDELFRTLNVVYKFLSNWDKEFVSDMIDYNNYSIKQKALLLRIVGSINYSMWKNNLKRDWLWNQIEEDEIKIHKSESTTYDIDEVTEEELTDETELIDDFKFLKLNFDDIMESKLYDHQVTTVNFLMTRESGNGIVASTTGSGKTIVAITYAEQLYLENKIEHIIIICPLSMIETWKREIIKHSKLKDLSKYTIINYEKILKLDFDNTENTLAILDEAHKMKNNLSKRYQKFIKYKWKYVIPLSATVVGNRLDELKNIYNLMGKKAPVRQGDIDLKLLKRDLIRVPKSKLNLPQFIKKDVPIQLNFNDEYELFKNDVLEDIEKDKQISIKEGKRPSNILVKLLRLNQYCSNRNIIMEKQFPIDEQNKFKVMFEIIDDEEKDEQFIIWSNFVDSIKNITLFLSEYFNCEYIDGSVKQDQRTEILDDFKNKKFKILIANPSTLSTGVTLVNSNKMIYFDRDFSSIKFIQALGRIYRIGQEKQCTMYNLFYEDTIEEYIIEVLKDKEEMINNILENGTNTEKLISKDILEKLKKKDWMKEKEMIK